MMNHVNEHRGDVLVVEDQEDARFMLRESLEHADYTVGTAGDGLQAIKEMEHRHFDVVITDYQMPRMNGLELLRLSKVLWPDTPVVMVTGDSSDVIAEVAMREGAYALVHKPYERTLLLQILRMAVLQSRADHTRLAASSDVNEPQTVDRPGGL